MPRQNEELVRIKQKQERGEALTPEEEKVVRESEQSEQNERSGHGQNQPQG